MRVLFTGASSFTGMWFVQALVEAGHEVTAICTRGSYADPLRQARVARVEAVARVVHGVSFGDEAFLGLIRENTFDLLAHHAADVTNYKSPDFDPVQALGRNTFGLAGVLEHLPATGCRRILLTGSVFEGGEGAGSEGLPDFSPYGLSKRLTSEVFSFACRRAGVVLGKFVIPNPFGAYEEARYTAYLVKSWLAGQVPFCSATDYVRDNIHVGLLAKAYAAFAFSLLEAREPARLGPSGYVERQGVFTRRVAEALAPRLGCSCPIELPAQAVFSEPRVRLNTDPVDAAALGFSEARAWDQMAEFYLRWPSS